MSLAMTWYTLEEAEAKFGISRDVLLEWVEQGVVRTEREGRVTRVNVDDIELKVEDIVHM